MRHCKKKGRLNRRTSWRKATLKSLAVDLIKYQRIETTMAKAKALRVFVEPLITLSKNDKDFVSGKRRTFQKLCDRMAVKSLFDKIGPLYKDVPGGYTRVMALGTRKGDGAQTAIIELTKRTISDDDLLGKVKIEKKETKKKGKTAPEKAKEDKGEEEAKKQKTADFSEVSSEKKEGHAPEDIQKEKAKKEQKKVSQKGLFKRFRRKSIG